MSDGGNNPEVNEKEIVKVWRAWRTVHEMVLDRGYELTEEEVRIPLDTFKRKYCDDNGGLLDRSRLHFSARPSADMMRKFTAPATPSNPDPQPDCGVVHVRFSNDSALGAEQMRKFGKECAEAHYANGILVANVPVSTSAKKEIAKFAQWTTIEWFLEDDLLINITQHDLVPRHVLLSREEKIALLKRYRLKETQLPRILSKDPVAKYFGLKKGQVVKIIRKSETAGRYASYRLCV